MNRVVQENVSCVNILFVCQFQDPYVKAYHVKNHIDCKSSNVVYGVFCKKRNKIVYVGKTEVTLYQRHVLNISLIRKETNDPVAMHFYTNSHTYY